MQKREGRSFAAPPTIPVLPDLWRTGRKGVPHTGLPPQAPLPSLTSALSRRAALFGAVTVAGVTAAALPGAAAIPLSANDARLGIMDDRLNALQAEADQHAAGAALDPLDLYTLAVAKIDLVAAGMAMTPADTMGGVMLKLRAMAVPIVADDDEAHGLALSVCRDLRRLRAVGALS